MTDLPPPLDADSSDEQLWQAVVAGDPAAFGVFFRRHGPAVHRFCFRRTGSTQLAEDLTSVVFLQAWRSRAGVDLDTVPVRAWLFGIANHVTAKGTRSVRRHQASWPGSRPTRPPRTTRMPSPPGSTTNGR